MKGITLNKKYINRYIHESREFFFAKSVQLYYDRGLSTELRDNSNLQSRDSRVLVNINDSLNFTNIHHC